MIKLEPCPFCGSKNLTLIGPIPQFAYSFVRCNSCRGFGPDAGTTDQAAKAWNNRYDFKIKLASKYGKTAGGE